MHKSNNLSKMLLLSPEVYNTLKNEIEQSANLSLFDKSMDKILKSKDLSDKEKWYNYRNELIKFFNVKRKKAQVFEKRKTKIPVQENLPVKHKSLRDSSTQTKIIFKKDASTEALPMIEDIFESEPFEIEDFDFEVPREKTPPKKSLSPAAKRRLSASGIAKSLKPPAKVPKVRDTASGIVKSPKPPAKAPKLRDKDYRVITGTDGITQYTVPMDMSVDEAADLIEELEEDVPKEKPPTKKPILRPSLLDPGQYELSFPVKKELRQSERLKNKKERSSSVPNVAWVRL